MESDYMKDEIMKAMRLTAEQIGYEDRSNYSQIVAKMRQEQEMYKLLVEQEHLMKIRAQGGVGIYFDDVQRSKDITGSIDADNHRIVLEGLEYRPELIMRVTNIADITELSHDIRRSCVHGVHLKYERQQNRLDIYFEKAQDYVLVKMFTE